jgi:hypothetical protein
VRNNENEVKNEERNKGIKKACKEQSTVERK